MTQNICYFTYGEHRQNHEPIFNMPTEIELDSLIGGCNKYILENARILMTRLR